MLDIQFYSGTELTLVIKMSPPPMRRSSTHPANPIKRVLAYFIDTVPITLALYLVSTIFFGISPLVDQYARPEVHLKAEMARQGIAWGTLFIWLLYCICGEISPMKGTYGKKMMGIIVLSGKGRRLTLKKAILRNLAKILSILPCYLGFFAAFVSHGRRGWHDMLTDCSVEEKR